MTIHVQCPNTLVSMLAITAAPEFSKLQPLLEGLGAQSLHVSSSPFVALYREIAADDFVGERGEKQLNDPDWVERQARSHADDILQLSQAGMIYPSRFATLYSTPFPLEEMLINFREELSEYFLRIANADEWAIKVFVELESATLHAMKRTAIESITNHQTSSGSDYLKRRMREREVLRELPQRLASRSDEVTKPVLEIANEFVERPLLPKGMIPSDHLMLHNYALLISRDKLNTLRQTFEIVREELSREGMILEISGPWPCYSFRTLRLSGFSG